MARMPPGSRGTAPWGGVPSQTRATWASDHLLVAIRAARPRVSGPARPGGNTPVTWRTLNVSTSSLIVRCTVSRENGGFGALGGPTSEGILLPVSGESVLIPGFPRFLTPEKRPHGHSDQIASRRVCQPDAPPLQEALRKRGPHEGRQATSVLREAFGATSPRVAQIDRQDRSAAGGPTTPWWPRWRAARRCSRQDWRRRWSPPWPLIGRSLCGPFTEFHPACPGTRFSCHERDV